MFKQFFVFVCIASLAMACGGEVKPAATAPIGGQGDEPTVTDQAAPAGIMLQSLVLNTEAFVNMPIVATVSHPPLSAGMSLQFNWQVNKTMLDDVDAPVLPIGRFKPNDWVSCQVNLLQGDQAIQTMQSNLVQVGALAPILSLDPLGEFQIPGEFRYQIVAQDPNEPAGQDTGTLSFELLEPQTENIILNEKTGEIRWFIDEEAAKRLGTDGVNIKFRVNSSWGSSVSSDITVNFQKTEVKDTQSR